MYVMYTLEVFLGSVLYNDEEKKGARLVITYLSSRSWKKCFQLLCLRSDTPPGTTLYKNKSVSINRSDFRLGA